MKIFVGQIYTRVGVEFPFTLQFQRWLGDALSKRVETSKEFTNKFGDGYGLGIRISAKEDVDQPVVKGPTLFKRDKSIEFTVFFPHQLIDYHDPTVAVNLVDKMLQITVQILQQLGLNPGKIDADIQQLLTEFRNTPGLLDPHE